MLICFKITFLILSVNESLFGSFFHYFNNVSDIIEIGLSSKV